MLHKNNENNSLKGILLDTKKCQACWKCIKTCPNNVIDKISILWHKHAKIINPENCTLCNRCVGICSFNAISIQEGK